MYIKELFIHPLKSARALACERMAFDAMGPLHDRRWMLVDANGRFVTQRTHPRLCLLSAVPEAGGLRLSAPGQPELLACRDGSSTCEVEVWEDRLTALAVSELADRWCSAFLGMPVRLVEMAVDARREVSPAHAGPGHLTAFSDGFPLLLVTQSSLDALNARLPAPVDWRRFRPNLVVGGEVAAHAEDGWRGLRIGEIELEVVKPCSRCVIPSIDPDTAVKNSQILTVLRSYRARADGKTYFGQNVVIRHCPPGAFLTPGARVELLS